MPALGTTLTWTRHNVSYDFQRGYVTEDAYEGPSEFVAAATLSLDKDQSWSIDNSDAPRSVLTIRTPDRTDTPTNEDMVFAWEIAANEIQKPILTHPKAMKLGSYMRADILDRFNQTETYEGKPMTYSLKKEALKVAGESLYGGTPESPHELTIMSIYLLDRLIANQDSFQSGLYVARLTQTVGSRYSKQISDSNVEKIYTTEELISEGTANGTPMPDRLQYKLRQIPEKQATDKDGVVDNVNFRWGWLKKNSTETQTARYRIQIVTEWVLDLLPTFDYDTVS